MQRYILQRLLLTLPVICVVTLVLFVLLRLTPGDPVRNQFGIEGTQEQIEAQRRALGLDRPIVIQYFDWVAHMARGDFGRSLHTRRSVSSDIWQRLPATLELQVVALVVAIGVALPLGTLAALKRDTPIATATTSLTLVSIAVPGFLISTLLIYFFTYKIRVFETPRYVPLTDDPWRNLSNLVLPVIALSHGSLAVYTRFIRSSLGEVLSQPYIRTARAKGLSEWKVVTQHALRNAILPFVTLLGLSLGTLWTGTFITESIFNWPGVGRLTTNALLSKDYPVIQAVVFLVAITYALANLVVDIAYAVLDPRISDSLS